jgi:hypothetical protein
MSRSTWIITLVVVAVSTFLTLRRLARERPVDRQPVTYEPPAPDPNVLAIRGTEVFVRQVPGRSDQAVDAVRAAVASKGTVYPRSNYIVVLWHDFRAPEDVMAALSRDLQTDVIWLAFQKTVDAFAFQHWKDGKRLRRLTFGCYEKERTWEEVDGSPEPWEAQAFFGQDRLELKLELTRQFSESASEAAREAERLRTIWRDRKLEADSHEPDIEARDAAEAVAIAYGLPGWFDTPQP